MHGHYHPVGGFFYCNSFEKEEKTGVPNNSNIDPEELQNNAHLRVIPYMLTKKNKHFDIKDCTFNMEEYKTASARQVFFNEFQIKQSFTLENSFLKKTSDKDISDNR